MQLVRRFHLSATDAYVSPLTSLSSDMASAGDLSFKKVTGTAKYYVDNAPMLIVMKQSDLMSRDGVDYQIQVSSNS